MISRRPGDRMNRGRVASVFGPSAPAQPNGTLNAAAQSSTTDFAGTFTSNLPLSALTIAPGWTFYLVADVGLSGGGAATMTWLDQSGNGNDFTQSSAGFIPTTGGVTLNGRPSVTFDGSNDFLGNATMDIPAPGTTPSWIFSVWRLNTWAVGKNIYAGGSTTCMRLLCNGSTPQMQKTNVTASGLISPTLANWQCAEDYYSNSAADYLRIGALATTPAGSGNTDPAAGGFRIGSSNGAGAGAPAMDMVFIGRLPRLPTGTEITNLRAWVTSMWGASVQV